MCKVSVLMPIYRTKIEYLKESIESILKQTFSDFEFIILDDCPDDSRENIVLGYKDKRIKYLKNELNLGISASRNKLFDLAQGQYFAIFDHDDISKPYRLEKQVLFLDSNPNVGVVSGQLEYIYGNIACTAHPESNLEIKKALMKENVVAHTAMMLRRSVIKAFNIRYEEKYSPAEDYMLVLKLMEYTMFHNLPQILVSYRNFEGNTTNLNFQKMIDADAMCRCFAFRNYPYLYNQTIFGFSKEYKTYWIKLFDIIPFIKVKGNCTKRKIYIFGFVKLFTVNYFN